MGDGKSKGYSSWLTADGSQQKRASVNANLMPSFPKGVWISDDKNVNSYGHKCISGYQNHRKDNIPVC
jgi:hypothetical protein